MKTYILQQRLRCKGNVVRVHDDGDQGQNGGKHDGFTAMLSIQKQRNAMNETVGSMETYNSNMMEVRPRKNCQKRSHEYTMSFNKNKNKMEKTQED